MASRVTSTTPTRRLRCRGLLLDATLKGGIARYINHSCDPNCATQKWIVRGETRVGIFATKTIRPGQEITYDYRLEWNGAPRVRCVSLLTGTPPQLGAYSCLFLIKSLRCNEVTPPQFGKRSTLATHPEAPTI